MEHGPAELKLDNQDPIRNSQSNTGHSEEHFVDEDEEATGAKRTKLEDSSDENLECLKSLCAVTVITNTDGPGEPQPGKSKPDAGTTKKKAKKAKKKSKPETQPKKRDKDAKPSAKKKEQAKQINLRKNIREILKDGELEAETRAAQQREMERVQRLHQQQQLQQRQQIAECSFIPSFEIDDDDDGDGDGDGAHPASSLVEDLQALAQELEADSALSPEFPPDFLEQPQQPSQQLSSINIPPAAPIQNPSRPIYDDVICLSSDDEEPFPKPAPLVSAPSKPYIPYDDDDVVILSGDDEKPEVAEDEDGDVHNFGLHTRDHMNLPDSQGRVLVNVGHPSTDSDIFLPPQLARAAKPHQVGGIRFLYDNLVESREQFAISKGFGCILAHSMGLGKTFQVCTFSEVFLRHTGARTVLVIVPINTIQNWVTEYNHWLPPPPDAADAPLESGVQPRCFHLHVLNDTTKDLNSRARVINEWATQGGVLLVGYELYRLFYTQHEKCKKNAPRKRRSGVVDLEEEEREKIQLERIYAALVNPGPELVICDEGHRIKNMKAGISVALKEIQTRRRVVLTGYPLQNNLIEYWCMVDFVRPNFLGTRNEFSNMFERPIQNGQCLDSSPADVKLMKERVYVLHSLVKGFVQRRSQAVLRSSLPHKEEHVLLLRMTPLQRSLYRHYMSELVQNKSVSNPLKAFAICLKIWNHPDVLYKFNKKSQDDVDLDLEEEALESSKKTGKKTKKRTTATAAPALPTLPSHSAPFISMPTTDDESGEASTSVPASLADPRESANVKEKRDETVSYDWADELLKDYVPGNIENAAKTQIFFTILEESVKKSDRLLVFSQSLFTLTLLEEFLQERCIPGRNGEKWAKNRSYFRLDGSTGGMDREKLVCEFNSNPEVMLFLISTRAGSLGINLIGANRVIIFDASWNPCHDAQAVCRIYRYGQIKPCYIYRFVTDNSLEKKIYDRQIGKQGTADRVVDELNPEARLMLRDVTCLVCDDEDDPPPKDYGAGRSRVVGLTDPILGLVLDRWGSSFTKDPFHHDALLAESKESKLSKAEKRMAQRLYEKAKLDGSNQYRRQSYSSYYPKAPLPISSMDNGSGPYSRSSPHFSSMRPSGVPGKPMVTAPMPMMGNGMEMLAEALAQGKLVCKEMVLNKDVTIARNQQQHGNGDTSPIVLPMGTRVKLIKTPKGVYMQTPEGKIFRIHSAAVTPPAPPSSIASALGMEHKGPPFPSSADFQAGSVSGATSSLADQAILRRIRDMQPAGVGSNGIQSISTSGKSALLAQLRHNLAVGRGASSSGGRLLDSISSNNMFPPTLPGSQSNLSHFTKRLASLAHKSPIGPSLFDLAGAGDRPLDDANSVNSGSNGASPNRPSSLLDPKARALPSAALHKKVTTATPNLAKARQITSVRPFAAVDAAANFLAEDKMPSSEPSMLASLCSAPSAISALTALSTAPMSAGLSSLTRFAEVPPDSDFASSKSRKSSPPTPAATEDSTSSTSSRSGLFDNLSLASQLEGFASCTTAAAAKKPESIKDLLKTPANGNRVTAAAPTLPWNGDIVGPNANYSWSNYLEQQPPQWAGSWNGPSTSGVPNGWSNRRPWSQQEQRLLEFGTASSNGGKNEPSSTADGPTTSPATSSAFGNPQQYSNYGASQQWANFSTATSSAPASVGSLIGSYPPAPPPYFPTLFSSNGGGYGETPSFSQTTQPASFSNLSDFTLNQYGANGSSDFTPGYTQPYPGSFTQ